MSTNRILTCLVLMALLSNPVSAVTISAPTSVLPSGTHTIDLILDPEGARLGAWLVVLTGAGLMIDSISTTVPAGTDCFGIPAGRSFDAQCASSPLSAAAVVARVTFLARAGGHLSIESGNATDFDTFADLPLNTGRLISFVPEPAGLVGLASLVALVMGRRLLNPSARHSE